MLVCVKMSTHIKLGGIIIIIMYNGIKIAVVIYSVHVMILVSGMVYVFSCVSIVCARVCVYVCVHVRESLSTH